MSSLSPHYQRILDQLAALPDTAKVPLPVAAVHEGVSVRTIKRNYPLINITDHRQAVLLGYLRNRQAQSVT
jgi:hypothetical protein